MENVIPSATSLKMFTDDVPVVKEPPKPKTIRVSKNITKRAVGKTKKENYSTKLQMSVHRFQMIHQNLIMRSNLFLLR